MKSAQWTAGVNNQNWALSSQSNNLSCLLHRLITDVTTMASSSSSSSSSDDKLPEGPPSPSPSSSSPETWKERVIIPTVLAGVFGAGAGLVSKHRKTHGLANISATYATNFAIVTGCYCGAREFVRISRTGKPDDLLNSAIGGFASGAILGRLQGGQLGAIRYSILFAVVGTTVDYATLKLKPVLRHFYDSMAGSEIKLPEWSPIKVLDEEALAAKRAREKQIYENIHNLQKEKS